MGGVHNVSDAMNHYTYTQTALSSRDRMRAC